MNLCRRCESEYDKPGTCNCFAEAPMVVTPLIYPGTVVPIFVHPVSPYYPYWYGTMTNVPPPTTWSGETVTVSSGGSVSGNVVSAEQAEAFSAGSTPTPLVTSENFGSLLLEAARQCVEYDRQH